MPDAGSIGLSSIQSMGILMVNETEPWSTKPGPQRGEHERDPFKGANPTLPDSSMHEAVAAIAACGVSPVVRIAANEGWMVKRMSNPNWA